jgi:hypothetical protein
VYKKRKYKESEKGIEGRFLSGDASLALIEIDWL